jgi:hypothetical protein
LHAQAASIARVRFLHRRKPVLAPLLRTILHRPR